MRSHVNFTTWNTLGNTLSPWENSLPFLPWQFSVSKKCKQMEEEETLVLSPWHVRLGHSERLSLALKVERPAAVTGGWAHPVLGEEGLVKSAPGNIGSAEQHSTTGAYSSEHTGWSLRTTPWVTISLETPMEKGEWGRTQPERKLPSHLRLTFNYPCFATLKFFFFN